MSVSRYSFRARYVTQCICPTQEHRQFPLTSYSLLHVHGEKASGFKSCWVRCLWLRPDWICQSMGVAGGAARGLNQLQGLCLLDAENRHKSPCFPGHLTPSFYFICSWGNCPSVQGVESSQKYFRATEDSSFPFLFKQGVIFGVAHETGRFLVF